MNPRPDAPASALWFSTARPAPDLPELEGERRAEVAIVGAGILGCATALRLAERGVRVVVLEAREPGFGASGRNNGQVIPTITRPNPDDIVRAFGETVGPRLVRLIGGAAAEAFELIRAHRIDCDAVQNGWVQPAHRESRMALAKSRVEQWSRHGMDVRMLSRDEVSGLLGSDRYHGGWMAPTGGHINPLGYSRGLAGAALAAGAAIHARSPATAIRPEGSGWRIETPRGAVVAPKVLLATAGYTDGLWPGLARSVVPATSWQAATAPLPRSLRARILPTNVTMSDTQADLRFCHFDRDGRLVAGGALIFTSNAVPRLRRIVAQRLRHIFPALRDHPELRIEQVWNGEMAMTQDHLPHFHALADGVFASLGCNGRGVAMNSALGRALADALTGVPESRLEVPLTRMSTIPAHALARRVARGLLAWYRIRDRRD
ncbi:MAG: hypothetical protein RIS35_3465 [Pseudomonadota bacterium]|jgi:glycine/D-amino acid oxidase-like deaminating enzyme